MMRKGIVVLYSFLFCCNCFSQEAPTDSLLALLKATNADTVRVNILNQLSTAYFNSSSETAIKYGNQAKDLAENLSYTTGLAYALKNIGIGYYMQADYLQTLTYWNQSLSKFEEAGDKKGIANILSNLGAVYYNHGDDARALDYYLRSLKYAEATSDTVRLVSVLNNIGALYFNKPGTHDKALNYYLQALPLCEAVGDDDMLGTITVNVGEIYLAEGNDILALMYFNKSAKAYKNSKNLSYSLVDIGKVYEHRHNNTTALKYYQDAYDIANKLSSRLEMSQSLQGMANIYAKTGETTRALDIYNQSEAIAKEIPANYELEKIYKGLADIYAGIQNYTDAYKYQALLTAIKDTLYNAETDKKLEFLQFNFEIQKKQGEIDLLTKDKRVQEADLQRQATVRNALLAVLLLVITIVFILFRNYRIKDRAGAMLRYQKKELERTLNDLNTTQSQLIQSEKMASLGELTAGIAHEIQNPLNFVNNFSEVNTELIEELRNEKLKPKEERDENLENELLNDIAKNEQKINHHGKRADAIVKGMLQHSRSSGGSKEPTDINALADEYLRLTYHGLRAKDKSFNATTSIDFDKTIKKINIIPQDVGRVILNLLTNAFYAVQQKQKAGAEGYEPTVSIGTKKENDLITISIKDNGGGIPQKVLDKIFQPFFTTKPTGEGTGLGLSLSYDIIKAHGGELIVKTNEGEGSEFIIQLPNS